MNALTSQSNLSRAENRKEKRGSVLKSAKIICDGSWGSVFDCLVLDLSDKGARVETILTINVPDVFYLKFSDNTRRLARRRWSSGNQIGIEFVDATS